MSDYAAARTAGALFDRPRGLIEASGTEAAVFLHNLCTNDIKGLAPGRGAEAFFCTATAKVIAHGHVWRGQPEGKRDTLWLDLDDGLAARTFAHLDRYLISEDVALTDRTAEVAQLHLAGPALLDILRRAGVDAPAWERDTCHTAGPLRVRFTDPLGLPGCDLLCPAAQAPALRQSLLAAGAAAGSAETFDVLRVEAGTPAFGRDMDETTFAPEVGRTLQAISYAKGCYLGQEPIVMARDRGIVQRGLLGVLLGEGPVPPGTLLFRDGKEVGRTASCVVSPALGQAIALAYLRRGSQAPGTAVEAEVGGQRRPASVAKLPFVG